MKKSPAMFSPRAVGKRWSSKKASEKNLYIFILVTNLVGSQVVERELIGFYLLIQDVIACTTAIRSCEMLGHWSAGLQILEFMPSVQITPDAWCWLGKAGEVEGHKKNTAWSTGLFWRVPCFKGWVVGKPLVDFVRVDFDEGIKNLDMTSNVTTSTIYSKSISMIIVIIIARYAAYRFIDFSFFLWGCRQVSR